MMSFAVAFGRVAVGVVLAAASVGMKPEAWAQSEGAYPQRVVRIVVPFPAGGYSDVLARLIGRDMSQTFGQSVVVDNRPGAGGNIGSDLVAKAAPDGYTMVMASIATHAVNAALYPKMPYDGVKDFAAIAFVADAETVLVVHPSVKARSVAELIALSKASPDGLTFASAGAGTTSHLAGEMFKTATGTALVHVPYKGNAPAIADLVAGQVSLAFATMTPALPFIRAGKLVPLATLGDARSLAVPDVPTLDEAHVHGIEVRNWTGLLAPVGTPRAVTEKIAAEVDKVMRSADVQTMLANEGLKYTQMGPDRFSAFVKAETEKWAKIVSDAGVKAD